MLGVESPEVTESHWFTREKLGKERFELKCEVLSVNTINRFERLLYIIFLF